MIKQFAGQSNVLTVPVVFIRYTGSIEAALLLSQILYWSDKKDDGWFYKTHKEWESELALTKYETRKATKLLVDKGILETKIKKVNGAPTLHFHLKEAEFSLSIVQFLNNPKCTDRTILESEKSELSINKRLPKTTNSAGDDDSQNPPFVSVEFSSALAEFEQHRRELRHKLTPTTRKRLYAQLARFGEAKAIRALNLSVEKGWQGVFDPDARNGNSGEHPNAYRPGKMIV